MLEIATPADTGGFAMTIRKEILLHKVVGEGQTPTTGEKRKYCQVITFSGLAKVAIFTTNVDAENQTLINHKCGYGALNRHFCQTRVITSRACCGYQ